ncbi:MAG: hypothetical protein EPO08_10010 [Rhodospirillaceae bacterium]|nr:MAG: hypothetical protein EPO08_10010 [Rhodospirillaceae bacterium]
MNQFRHVLVISTSIVAVLWMLTAPNWFARGALGRAMTDLDIWAQIHLPYPVLTLLLAGFVMTGATVWFRRHVSDEPDSKGIGARKR